MSVLGITLLRMEWLLLLPVLLGIGYALQRRNTGIGDWSKVMDPALLDAMRAMGRVRDQTTGLRAWLPLLVCAFIVLALAGPAQQAREAKSFRNLDGVVFVVDASRSMTADPLWPESVTTARIGISALGSRPAALVVFGGDSYPGSALTADVAQIGLSLTYLDENTIPNEGTRPELGLLDSVRILKDGHIVAGEVFLLTDGGGIGPEAHAAAQQIREAGATLSVIYAPTQKAAGRARVETLAASGGGQVFQLDQANALADHLSTSIAERLERQDFELLFQQDFGRYILALALIPLLALFRRRAS